MEFIRERLSFWLLTISYPVLAILSLNTRLLETSWVALGVLIAYTVLIVWLALDASLKIKVRTARIASTTKEIGDLIVDFFPLILTVAFAQVLVRDVVAIGSEPEFLRLFGYLVGKDANHVLQWTGSIWTVLIAYCIKYHWDAIVKAMEASS